MWQRGIFAVALTLLAACGNDALVNEGTDAGAVDASEAVVDGGAPPRDLASGPCPEQMALVDVPDGGRVCIDRYEGALVEILDGGAERVPSPRRR